MRTADGDGAPGTRTVRLSVIVPAYNAAAFFPRTLPPLVEACERDGCIELIVVDDHSTDGGAEVARALGARVHRHPENLGAAAARNTGAEVARGGVLLFLDADVVVAPTLPAATLDIFDAQPSLSAITGRYDAEPANDTAFARYKALWTWHCWEPAAQAGRCSHLQGALFAIRASTFSDAGGFDARYQGGNVEDYELSDRLRARGVEIRFDGTLSGRHHFPEWATVARNYWDRARMWSRLRGSRPAFSSGQASLRNGASALLALSGAALHTAGVVIWPLHVPAMGLDLLWFTLQADFFRLAAQERGLRGTARMVLWHHSLHAVAGAAALSSPFGAGSRKT